MCFIICNVPPAFDDCMNSINLILRYFPLCNMIHPVLQRRQDIISEGDCYGGCDNVGVHTGLVCTVIVTLSSSSFLTSTILFSLLTS